MKQSDRNFKGIWIPKLIYLNRDVNWYSKILFLEIHSFTENGKECYMSNKYIASFLNISERQVSRYISELKAVGWIEEVGFDGRKRYLKSVLQVSFRADPSAKTKVSKLGGHIFPNSNDTKGYYNKPITNTHNKPKNLLNKKIENRSRILE